MKNTLSGAKRILDANINRAKEGLRVCEEITRFILEDSHLASGLKHIRHEINHIIEAAGSRKELILHRDTRSDAGKNITLTREIKRKNYQDIFFANLQRIKESIRVLEEFSKLFDASAALKFKKLRYGVYEIEKRFAEKILPLRHHG